MDPLTALAAIKGGITAGKSIMNMSKEIAGFFDSVDSAKKQHQKKILGGRIRDSLPPKPLKKEP